MLPKILPCQETADHHGHVLTHLHKVPVRIVKPNDALAPAVLDDAAQADQAGMALQLLQEAVQVGRLKAELHIVGPARHLLPGKSHQPMEVLLEGQAAGEGDVDAVVLVQLQAEQVLIKRPGGMKPLGRMKIYYLNSTDILYLRG